MGGHDILKREVEAGMNRDEVYPTTLAAARRERDQASPSLLPSKNHFTQHSAGGTPR
ncbi:hypothetical protein J7L06_00395 [Candidatus Bathyarchaeota archaeon]|nr:hypothetical protein [Candidatus Bathyarchaeota archaeon]